MSKAIDIRGIIYHNLLPLRHVYTKHTHAVWKCKCLRCGKATYVTYSNIASGNSKSCASCGQKKLSKEQEKEVAKRYLDGEKIVDLARCFEVNRDVVYGVLKRSKIKIRTRVHKAIKNSKGR